MISTFTLFKNIFKKKKNFLLVFFFFFKKTSRKMFSSFFATLFSIVFKKWLAFFDIRFFPFSLFLIVLKTAVNSDSD